MFFQIIFLLITIVMQFHNAQILKSPEHVIAEHSLDMNNRYSNKMVSDVFKDNILLNLAYIKGDVKPMSKPDWNKIEKPFHFEMAIHPMSTYAFHDNVLPDFQNKKVTATHIQFDNEYGFKSDGYLTGDGVCHLASLMYWAAKDANLSAVAPTNHNFANINGVPKEYGVAIYYNPGEYSTNANENLYITNNFSKDVKFAFDYDGSQLKVSVLD